MNWSRLALGQEVVIGDRSYGHVSSVIRWEGRVTQIGTHEYRPDRRTISGYRRVAYGFHFSEDGQLLRIEGQQ